VNLFLREPLVIRNADFQKQINDQTREAMVRSGNPFTFQIQAS